MAGKKGKSEGKIKGTKENINAGAKIRDKVKEKNKKGIGNKRVEVRELKALLVQVEQPVNEPRKLSRDQVFQSVLNASYLASINQSITTKIQNTDQPLLFFKDAQKLGKPIECILQDNPHPHLIQYMIDIGMMPMDAIHLPKKDNLTPVTKKKGLRMIRIDFFSSIDMVGLATCVIRGHAFVMYVREHSPAHIAGLEFGDEILEINDMLIHKWSDEDVKQYLTDSPLEEFHMLIRERPFARKFTLNSGNMTEVGFAVHDGRILNVWKDTDAYKKGLLVDHQIIEINGNNVIGMNDSLMRLQVKKDQSFTLTIMPGAIFDHLMDRMGRETVHRFYQHMLLPA